MFEEGIIIDVEGGKLAVEAVSVCVHGDGPAALQTAAHIKDGLIKAGFEMRNLPDMLTKTDSWLVANYPSSAW